mmetsp:Transcript_24423/g.35711  ORF Transcript_24423/g.35711 Transcript_24423/m.35711 type:complete len:273 (+) Transcript_24423:1243-2061(+)
MRDVCTPMYTTRGLDAASAVGCGEARCLMESLRMDDSIATLRSASGLRSPLSWPSRASSMTAESRSRTSSSRSSWRRPSSCGAATCAGEFMSSNSAATLLTCSSSSSIGAVALDVVDSAAWMAANVWDRTATSPLLPLSVLSVPVLLEDRLHSLSCATARPLRRSSSPRSRCFSSAARSGSNCLSPRDPSSAATLCTCSSSSVAEGASVDTLGVALFPTTDHQRFFSTCILRRPRHDDGAPRGMGEPGPRLCHCGQWHVQQRPVPATSSRWH